MVYKFAHILPKNIAIWINMWMSKDPMGLEVFPSKTKTAQGKLEAKKIHLDVSENSGSPK